MSKKKSSRSTYVRVEDCREISGKIQLALFGADGRGGLVKDVAEIKMATSWVKNILVPIVTSICAAVVTYLILQAI